MVRNGERLNAKDKKRLEAYIKERETLESIGQRLIRLEGQSATPDDDSDEQDNPRKKRNRKNAQRNK